MMRNIEALRKQGLTVEGKWLNKEVLMFDEASKQIQKAKHSPSKVSEKQPVEELDSILNIDLSETNADLFRSNKSNVSHSYV